MLTFVQDRNQEPERVQIKKLPHIDFGVSLESPQVFHHPQTMISAHSFINPFLDLNQNTASRSLCFDETQINPHWAHESNQRNLKNHSQMQMQKGFLTSRNDQNSKDFQVAPGLSQSINFEESKFEQYCDRHHQKVFHKKKGEFTTYYENHVQNVDFIGPILGTERTGKRNKKTKAELLALKRKKLQQLKLKRSQNSEESPEKLSPLLQKSRIHRQRLELLKAVDSQYKAQAIIKERTERQFSLPRINKQFTESGVTAVKENYKKFKHDNMNLSKILSSTASTEPSFRKERILKNNSTFELSQTSQGLKTVR